LKKSPSGARRPTEDVEPVKVNPKSAKGVIRTGCGHPKH
jgi:hypothetical protein